MSHSIRIIALTVGLLVFFVCCRNVVIKPSNTAGLNDTDWTIKNEPAAETKRVRSIKGPDSMLDIADQTGKDTSLEEFQDVATKLKTLKKLRDGGIISDEEYEKKRSELIKELD